MAEVRETQVAKDAEGDVLDRRTVIERPHRDGGFGWGLLLGVVLVAIAVLAFAYGQGSFRTADREADKTTRTGQVELNQTADNTRQAANNAADRNNNNRTSQQ